MIGRHFVRLPFRVDAIGLESGQARSVSFMKQRVNLVFGVNRSLLIWVVGLQLEVLNDRI
jgi:hypothetical protein